MIFAELKARLQHASFNAILVAGLFSSCLIGCGEETSAPIENHIPPGIEFEKISPMDFMLTDFKKEFIGKLDGKYPIRMSLECKAGVLTGTYQYEGKQSKPLTVKGKLLPEREIHLEELDSKGNPNGTFTGIFISSDMIEGWWSSPQSGEPMSFQLKTSVASTFDALRGIPLDSFPNVHVVKSLTHCNENPSFLSVKFPQISGATFNQSQINVNRHLREIFLQPGNFNCPEFESKAIIDSIDFRVSLLSNNYFSGYAVNGNSQPIFGFTYNLYSGEGISFESLVREPNQLRKMFFSLTGTDVAEIQSLKFYFDSKGVHFFLPGKSSLKIDWNSSQFKEILRIHIDKILP